MEVREVAMKILIASDGSAESAGVVQEAAARPWPTESQFWLVTMLDPFFFTRAPLQLEEAKKKTMEGLEEDAEVLKQAGWAVNPEVLVENPRRGIPRVASEWKADMILLGSHGRGAFSRLLLGSTAQAVLRHAACSVEVVRLGKREKRGAGEGMRVLIPTDGSAAANQAAQSVAERPWPQGSEFKVIAGPEFPVLVGEYPFYSTEQLTQVEQHSEKHAAEAAANTIAILAKAGLRAASEVTEPKDTPTQAILEAADAWGADLIVLGSHGRRGFDRLVLGSVSESVALHAHCSVEVNRRNSAG